MRRSRYRGWAAWAGLLALALNALVPIHIAFDLADALTPPHHHAAETGAPHGARLILALLVGHQQHGPGGKAGEHGKQHQHGCAVCGTLGALAGLMPAAALALPLPPLVAMPPAVADPRGEPATAALAYHSRAPPLL